MEGVRLYYELIQWQEKEESQEKPKLHHPRQCPSHPEQDFNSQSAESVVSSDTPTTPKESEQEPPSTLPLFLSISPLRSSNSPETLPRTTKRPELSPDTFFSPSETTKNSTNSSTTLPLLKEVSSPTSADPLLETNSLQESHPKQFDGHLCIIVPYRIFSQIVKSKQQYYN